MSSFFDGMAGFLNDIHGASVVYIPEGGGETEIQAVFRKEPVEVQDAEGHIVLLMSPSLKVPKDVHSDINRGDRVRPGNGVLYKVLNKLPSGSPAEDAFVICELEEVEI